MLFNKKSSHKKTILLVLIVLIFVATGAFFYKAGFTFSKIITIKNIAWEKIFGKLPPSEYMPLKDEDRINVLFLGLRGIGDENGGLLTDSIMIVSFKKSTGKIALISIPRDLYIQMLGGEGQYEKINAAFAIGRKKYQNGLDFSKKTISYVSGLYIDYAMAVDFKAFKTIIDDIGGITIYLDKPFIEDKQWWCDENGEECQPFTLEAGRQTIDGETALFYVRSRFSSSDFDRARRQQQVMLAIKDKVLSLNVLANPLIINNLFNTVAENVKIDTKIWELPDLIKLVQEADIKNINQKVFDISPEGFLYETMKDGIYILLPVGDNFNKIRETCQQIFK